MQFYTNIFKEKGNLFLRGKDAFGKRNQKIIKYKPYLFVPSPKETPYRNLQNQYIAKMEFDSIYEANQFIEKYDNVANFSVYGYDRWPYVYLSDNFTSEFNLAHLNIAILDIEVFKKEGFPSIEKADGEVIAITLKKGDKYYVLSTADFKNTQSDVVYFKCKDEEDLLTKFIAIWEKLDLDIVTGWNIDGFDIPYLIHRITKIFNKETAERLSPWRKLYGREVKYFGNTRKEWTIKGIAILDYLACYKKFDPYQRESYTLNYISWYELEEKKIEYEGSLNKLWETDKQKYIEYNIHDVRLVQKLEDKLKFLELAITIAYDAKINLDDALGTVLLWEVLILNYLKKQNIALPTKSTTSSTHYVEGGYVKEPLKSMFDWVVSFDLTSLYPHIIIGWNISPETYMGKMDMPNMKEMLQGNFPKVDNTIAANGCFYRKDIKGFLNALMEEQFKKRTEYKNKMLEYKKASDGSQESKNLISKYDNFQKATKIKINSLYGALGNAYFKFYDADNAEAVTITGQLIIQWAERQLNVFLNQTFGTTNKDYVIASDTDSLYVNLSAAIKDIPNATKQEKIDYLDKFSKEVLEPKFKWMFENLTESMNCNANVLHMKRENIAEKGLWRAKKNYATYVWDEEGVRLKTPKLKVMGMEPVRSNVPEICRKEIKKCLEVLFTGTEKDVQNFIQTFKQEFMALPISSFARPTSVKDYSKYVDRSGKGLYKLGAPIHVKASILYNNIIKAQNLDTIYPKIHDGDKIKYVHLKKFNPIGDDVFGAPNGEFPKELNLDDYVDREQHFEKSFLEPIKSILVNTNIKAEHMSTLEDFM